MLHLCVLLYLGSCTSWPLNYTNNQRKSGTPNATEARTTETMEPTSDGPSSKSWLGSSFSRGFKAAVGPHTHSKPVERCKRSGLSCVCFGGRIAKRKQSQLTRRPAASFYLSLLVVVVVVPSTPSSSRPDIWCLICLGWVANRARTEDCVGGDRHHKAPTAWT